MYRISSALLILTVFGLTGCSTPVAKDPAGPLILISIDGFRWDYLQRYDAPTLKQLAGAGVHARRMNGSFPTKTFPNHYTLVTGLRPQNHGIVSNYFFDPTYNESFNKNNSAHTADPRWWQLGEPIWITAEKQGLRSACFFWPGSEAEIRGTRPSYFQYFSKSSSAEGRVDELLRQLDSPPLERPRLGILYFDMVDIAGHDFGPIAPETGQAVKAADDLIARLLAGLAIRGLAERANLVIVSDHGMSETSPDRVIFLENLMDTSLVRVESTGPNGGVRPLTGTAAELAASIRVKAPPQLKVYLREEVPAHLHYRASERIPPIVLIADDHWNIESKVGWPAWSKRYSKGNHGWDPATPNMGALFIANGPAFRRRTQLTEVESINVYNLLCATLDIKPAANDGDDRLVRAALRN